MNHRHAEEHLHVVGGADALGGMWAPLIAEVASLTRLTPVVDEEGRGGPERAEQALACSATTSEPVLLLPAATGAAEVLRSPLRALVPVDDLRPERRIVQRWARRAEEAGLEVDQIHVLPEASLPAMWDGSGHHAQAWWSEIRRRHLVDARPLAVESGDPVEGILAAAGRYNLIILVWRGDPAAGQAEVLRGVIAQVGKPALLVRKPPPGTAPGARIADGLRKI